MSDKNTCEACPVHAGTHKPAEAVHQIQESQPVLADARDAEAVNEQRSIEAHKEHAGLNHFKTSLKTWD